jgi:RNA-directed DNA polymerase
MLIPANYGIQTLNTLRVEQHPYKTMIGRGSRGFDFLGYVLTPTGLEASPETVKRYAARIIRLYEQGADIDRIGEYVTRWVQWLKAGVEKVDNVMGGVPQLRDIILGLLT